MSGEHDSCFRQALRASSRRRSAWRPRARWSGKEWTAIDRLSTEFVERGTTRGLERLRREVRSAPWFCGEITRVFHPSYSYRKATRGSTFAARHAGNQQAISETIINEEAITINVNGSLNVTP